MKTFLVLSILSVGIAIGKDPLGGTPIGTGETPVLPKREAETNRLVVTAKLVNQLAEEARTNHPAMHAAEARVRAAAQNARAVKLFEDPEVMFGGMVGSGVPREEEGNLVYGVEQKLPITGKPQAERKMARAEADVEEAARDYRFQTLRKEIADSAFKAALADEVLRVTQQDQAWVETMVAVTTERYKAGRSTQVELLRMESEHATRAEQLRVARRDRESELLNLNRLLNRPLTNAWPELELPELAGELASSERLLELATRFEPKLRMMRQDVRRAEAGAEVARRARRPDFTIGADARQFAGDGEFKEGTIYMKMSVPWFNKKKYNTAFRREKDRAEAATWDASEYEIQLRDDILKLVIRIENARRQAVLYRDQIIPRGEQALVSAESNWQGGRLIFLEVLEARRFLLEGRLMQGRAVAEQYRALAELVLCCGLGDLEAVELFLNIQTQK